MKLQVLAVIAALALQVRGNWRVPAKAHVRGSLGRTHARLTIASVCRAGRLSALLKV